MYEVKPGILEKEEYEFQFISVLGELFQIIGLSGFLCKDQMEEICLWRLQYNCKTLNWQQEVELEFSHKTDI